MVDETDLCMDGAGGDEIGVGGGGEWLSLSVCGGGMRLGNRFSLSVCVCVCG